MNKAEEFLKSYDCNLETMTLYGEKLTDILEAYHQSEVNAISDEMIKEVRPKGLDYYFTKSEKIGYNCAINDIKNKLLNK